jgi:hypothetical protein
MSEDVHTGSKGQYSCYIESKSIFGVVTSGNLTSGRVHLGASSATSNNNYNYSDRDGSISSGGYTNPCAMPFTGRPAAVKLWVKFVPASGNSADVKAKFSAFIHSDADYIAYNSPSHDSDGNKALLVASAVAEIPDSKGEWQELTIPFTYTENEVEPAYILINAYTNTIPGKGKENDRLYIDDIEMVYPTAVDNVSLDKTEAQSIDVGGTVSFTASVKPDNATDKKVKWSVGGTNSGAVTLYSDATCNTPVTLNTALPIN